MLRIGRWGACAPLWLHLDTQDLPGEVGTGRKEPTFMQSFPLQPAFFIQASVPSGPAHWAPAQCLWNE